ncbi:hypothetical protein PanWU01x14_277740, partial [Parasponia andersonii]
GRSKHRRKPPLTHHGRRRRERSGRGRGLFRPRLLLLHLLPLRPLQFAIRFIRRHGKASSGPVFFLALIAIAKTIVIDDESPDFFPALGYEGVVLVLADHVVDRILHLDLVTSGFGFAAAATESLESF